MIVHQSCWQCVCVGPRAGRDEGWAVWLGWFGDDGEIVPVELLFDIPVESEILGLGKVTGKKLNLPVYRMDARGTAKKIQGPPITERLEGRGIGDPGL